MKQLTELATPFASVAETSVLPGDDLPWLQALRQQALTQFSSAGLPAKKEEDWKYTSLWSLTQQAFTHDAIETTIVPEQCEQMALLDDAYRLVIVDGEFATDLSQLDGLPSKVTVQPFSTSLASVEQQLGQQVALDKAGLTALNTLLMKEGVMVHIAADVVLDKPIELLVINSGATANLAAHLRNMIVLDENARATVI